MYKKELNLYTIVKFLSLSLKKKKHHMGGIKSRKKKISS